MTPSGNTTRLKALMAKHRLSAPDVAKILKRSAHTVAEWRCSNANNIPDHLLELLELRLASRGVNA